jgi:hypothetical protein
MNEIDFFDRVAQLIEQARAAVGRTIDLTMCITYFEVGRMIVEREQDGEIRAAYGRKLLAELSAYLSGRFGKGFSETNLKNFRKFYQVYAPSIGQMSSAEFKNVIGQTTSAQSYPFCLSWSHTVSARQGVVTTQTNRMGSGIRRNT